MPNRFSEFGGQDFPSLKNPHLILEELLHNVGHMHTCPILVPPPVVSIRCPGPRKGGVLELLYWSRFCDCCWRVLFTCQSVTPLLTFCSFTAHSNLSPKTQNFCMLAHGNRGPREWISVEMKGLGAGIVPWKFQSPWKSQISFLFVTPSSPGGFLLNTLAPKWAALTLTLCTQHCVPVSHLHVPYQNSTLTCLRTVWEAPSCSLQLLYVVAVSLSLSSKKIRGHLHLANLTITMTWRWALCLSSLTWVTWSGAAPEALAKQNLLSLLTISERKKDVVIIFSPHKMMTTSLGFFLSLLMRILALWSLFSQLISLPGSSFQIEPKILLHNRLHHLLSPSNSLPLSSPSQWPCPPCCPHHSWQSPQTLVTSLFMSCSWWVPSLFLVWLSCVLWYRNCSS